MSNNPLDDDPDRDRRIRERAYHLWQSEGQPHGRDLEYWERARELIGMEDHPDAGQLPNPEKQGNDPSMPAVEEASIQENYGEIPGRMTDQGDRPQTPIPRKPKEAAVSEPPVTSSKTKVTKGSKTGGSSKGRKKS